MARIVLCHGRDLYSRLIQFDTFSYWSHAAFELDEAGNQLGALSQGVCITPPARGTIVSAFDVKGFDLAGAVSAAKTQIGRPYDWTAIAGIVMRRDWREPDSWFCSELVAWACQQAGIDLLRFDHMNRVTPGQLALSPLLRPVYEKRLVP